MYVAMSVFSGILILISAAITLACAGRGSGGGNAATVRAFASCLLPLVVCLYLYFFQTGAMVAYYRVQNIGIYLLALCLGFAMVFLLRMGTEAALMGALIGSALTSVSLFSWIATAQPDACRPLYWVAGGALLYMAAFGTKEHPANSRA